MEFLFSNKDIAVVLKPVGLDSEQEVPAAIVSALGGEVFPIHRLDKNVGGCMVYARRSGRRLTISWPADLPQNRAYRSGTRLLPCLRRYRLAVVRIKELEFSLLKPSV